MPSFSASKRKARTSLGGASNGKRRTLNGSKSTRGPAKSKPSHVFEDDEIDENEMIDAASDDEREQPHNDDEDGPIRHNEDDQNADFESVDETRVRLTKHYLDEIKAQTARDADDDSDAEDAEESLLDARLIRDVEDERGTRLSRIAQTMTDPSLWTSLPPVSYHRLHRLSVTCAALSRDDRFSYTGSKDGTIVEYDIEAEKKITVWKSASQSNQSSEFVGHRKQVTAIARSDDARYLATGGSDGILRVYDSRVSSTSRHSLIHNDQAHKSAVSDLAFRLNTATLYSCSHDRTVKVWDVAQSSPYVETLFGHTSAVNAIDAGSKLTCVTASSDKTLRMWKVETETQLLFRADAFATSIDTCAMVNENSWIAGGEDGSIHHWLATKKKPTDIIPRAHGGSWVTAVGAGRMTDLALTGANDGFCNIYQITTTNKLSLLHRVPVVGFINSIAVASSHRFALCAIGQEHKNGRWLDPIKSAKNGIAIVPLPQSSASQ